jgi:tRNA dimethylallyltransferase
VSELPVVALNGPTASGKTAVAVAVAHALAVDGIAAEVVNADSMLVYRGMDIGTAKPTVEERGGITHHLIDILEVTETASVADFQTRARERIADCRGRGVVPILAGGSALYVHAIVDEFDFPPTDDAVRARLEGELDVLGAPALYERLRVLSPQAAASILPGNGRRIVRALEALEVTGEFRSELPQWRYALSNVLQFGLEVPRDVLDARINARVDQMWADGLVDEVRALEALGLREGRTASRAIGYRQVLAMFDGELTETEARAAIAQGTRRLARKQLGWFRRDDRIVWMEPDDAAQRIASAVRARLLQADQEVGHAHDRVR